MTCSETSRIPGSPWGGRGRLRSAVLAAVVTALVAAGCGSEDDAGSDAEAAAPTLRIEERPWVGTDGAQPAPETTTFPVRAGTEIPLTAEVGETTVRIDEVRDGEITISVEAVAPLNPGGGINLTECGDQRFTLAPDASVEFATCSHDAGTIWQVTSRAG